MYHVIWQWSVLVHVGLWRLPHNRNQTGESLYYWTFAPLKYAIHNTNSILKGLILCNVSLSSYPIDLNVTMVTFLPRKWSFSSDYLHFFSESLGARTHC